MRRSDRFGEFLLVFLIIFGDFLIRYGGEPFVGQFRTNDLKGGLGREEKSGGLGTGGIGEVLILFVESAKCLFTRRAHLIGIKSGRKSGDIDFDIAENPFPRFERLTRNRRDIAVTGRKGRLPQRISAASCVRLTNHSFVDNLVGEQSDEHILRQSGLTKRERKVLRGEPILEQHAQIAAHIIFIRPQPLFQTEFGHQPAIDHVARIGERPTKFLKQRGQIIERNRHLLTGNRVVFEYQKHLAVGNHRLLLHQLHGRGVEKFAQTANLILMLGKFPVIEVADRFRFRIDRSDALLLRRADLKALEHRTERDEREHRKEGQSGEPRFLVLPKHTERIMFGHEKFILLSNDRKIRSRSLRVSKKWKQNAIIPIF